MSLLSPQQMTLVLEKVKWNLDRAQRGHTKVLYMMFPDEAFSLRVTMEIGNGYSNQQIGRKLPGKVQGQQTSLETIVFEEGGGS